MQQNQRGYMDSLVWLKGDSFDFKVEYLASESINKITNKKIEKL